MPKPSTIREGFKWCPKCSTVKPVEAFAADNSRRSGLKPHCRLCDNARRSAAKLQATWTPERLARYFMNGAAIAERIAQIKADQAAKRSASALIPMIDARGLHKWLGVSERFTDWMKRRLVDYRFEEGADWVFPKFQKNPQNRGGRPLKEYLITLDMAKELAMIERTEIGRHTRRYFIKMEKAALEMASSLAKQGKVDQIPASFMEAVEARFAKLEAAPLPALTPQGGEVSQYGELPDMPTKTPPAPVPTGEKHCFTCGQTKPLQSFYRNRKTLDGRFHCCRRCCRRKTTPVRIALDSVRMWKQG